MADQDRERLLAAFADHLLKNRLADEKHGRYMAGWVRRFLAFPAPLPGATAEECLQAYLRTLETERHEDWQVEQARISVAAWLAWRRGQAAHLSPVPKLGLAADHTVDRAQALEALTRTMRIRHYSYRTEQTYLDWVRRFFDYLISTGNMADGRPVLTEVTFQSFISHLAMRLHVAANTQNQAFASLLFLYRDVLGAKIGQMEDTVRAKRGQRLPTVLSVDEVRSLFDKMEGTPRLMAELLYVRTTRTRQVSNSKSGRRSCGCRTARRPWSASCSPGCSSAIPRSSWDDPPTEDSAKGGCYRPSFSQWAMGGVVSCR